MLIPVFSADYTTTALRQVTDAGPGAIVGDARGLAFSVIKVQ